MKNAVILVAGRGSRLRPYTDTRPKCFVEVNKYPIIYNTLDALAKSGCKTVIIVVGYMKNYIKKAIGDSYRGMNIFHIANPDYENTNNMFSLHLGLKFIRGGTWIIEGDIFIEHRAFTELEFHSSINWLVDSSCRIDGSQLTCENGIIKSIDIVRDLMQLKSNQSKSCGILNVTDVGISLLRNWLKLAISENRKNDYYDLIIKDNIDKVNIGAVDIAGYKWFEIDTTEDLLEAEKIFK